MATQIKTIKQKIASVGNIRKITRTMEMVSVAKMRKAINRAIASRDYAKYALEILLTLVNERNISHPLMETREGDTTLLVIIASNKGLCGSYNMNVSKTVAKYIKENANMKIDAIVVGKQAEKIARRFGLNVLDRYHEFKDDFTLTHIKMLRRLVVKLFSEKNHYKNVVVAYTEFVKQMVTKAGVKEILPVTANIATKIVDENDSGVDTFTPNKRGMAEYIFEPSEQRVLDKLIPNFLSTLLFQVMLEANASEHSSRMFAMKNATDNATGILDDLVLTYNRARQANITQEVAEIIAGAEALQTQ
jgi:F-type H+-transporting ATPase subunit gamma